MQNHYNHHNKNHYNNRSKSYYPPRRDCTKSVVSAINRAYREVSSFYSDDANHMISYVNSHHFSQSPAQALHSVIDSYHRISSFYSDDVKRQMWKVLHKFSR